MVGCGLRVPRVGCACISCAVGVANSPSYLAFPILLEGTVGTNS